MTNLVTDARTAYAGQHYECKGRNWARAHAVMYVIAPFAILMAVFA